MPQKHLESTFNIPSAPTSAPSFAPRPKKVLPVPASRPEAPLTLKIPTDYKQKKITGTYHNNYVQCISAGGGEELSIMEYLEKIRPYLCDLKISGKWKIYLPMEMNSMSSKGSNEKCLVHSKSDNKDIMTGFDT